MHRLAELLDNAAPSALQRVATTLGAGGTRWEVLNVLEDRDCINHGASTATYYPEDHRDRPGQLRGVLELVLSRDSIAGAQIFRPRGWSVALLVDEAIKNLLEAEATGLSFVPIRLV